MTTIVCIVPFIFKFYDINEQQAYKHPFLKFDYKTLQVFFRRKEFRRISYVLKKLTFRDINPITGSGGGGQFDPPLRFFYIAQKPLELLTYKFLTFPKYEFNMFSKKFSSIYFFWVYFSCTFWNPRPNFPSSPLLNPLRSF